MALPTDVQVTLDLANKAASLLHSHRGLGSKTSFSGKELIECIRQSDLAPFFNFVKYDLELNRVDYPNLISRTYRWSILDCNMMYFHLEVPSRIHNAPFMVGSNAALTSGRLRPINKVQTIPQVIAGLRDFFEYLERNEQKQLALEERIKKVFSTPVFPFNVIVNKKGYLLSVKLPYKMKTVFQLKEDFQDKDLNDALRKTEIINDALMQTHHIQLKVYDNNETWIDPQE